MVEQPQRETAKICTVKDLLSGTYVVQEGWLANYVESKGRKLSRINIIGIVVSKPSSNDFSIDDGTGTIQVVDFNQQKKVTQLKIGEPVLVIGRPRQIDATTFIACETVNYKQLLEEPGWMSYRKKQLQQIPEEEYIELKVSTFEKAQEVKKEEELSDDVKEIIQKETVKIIKAQSNEVAGAQKSKIYSEEIVTADVTGDDILTFIKKKDAGEGCAIEDIVSHFGNTVDDHITTLITMGEIYEIKPGRVKVLE